MNNLRRYVLLVAAALLILSCSLTGQNTPTPLPPPPTDTPAQPGSPATDTPSAPVVTDTPAEPPTSTPAPPQGTPIQHLPPGQAIKVTYIHMLDGSNGWAIGGVNGDSNHVFHTIDGGQTWADVTPAEPASTDPGNPKSAIGFFSDTSTAWVAFFGTAPGTLPTAYIWFTHDSGANWEYTALTEPSLYQESYRPSDLIFIDSQHGWMIAHVGVGMNHDYYALLATSDGGLTWNTLISPQGETSGTQSCTKTSLDFVTQQVGWMGIDCHGVAPIPYFFKTEDDGSTWERVDLPAPPTAPDIFNQGYCGVQSPTLFTPTRGDFVLDCVQYSGNVSSTQSFLYETTDSGTNWNVFAYPGGPLQFIDAKTAFALGRDIQRSDDAGHTWTFVKTVHWDGQFSFIDVSTAWTAATNQGQIALVRTVDGGATWAEIMPVVVP